MAGMHGVAIGSGIVPQWQHDEVFIGKMEKGESIEILTTSEDLTIEQREIMQERQLISNPIKACLRSCVDSLNGVVDDSATPKAKPRRKRKELTMMDKVSKIVTLFQWVPQLTFHKVRADLVAGLTVGVMVIPQSMSYGAIAGLPYINGMYSACVPTLVYALFGQSRQLAVGPVAMVSLLIEAGLNGSLGPECDVPGKAQYEVCTSEYVGLACLAAALVGVMQVAASLLKLGFLVTFLGHPVISGFTSGAAIIIGLSQLKYMLGYDIPKSQYIYDTIINVAMNIQETKPMPLLLGVLWLAYLITNKQIASRYRPLKMLGPMGPLISCVAGTVLIWAWPDMSEKYHVKYVGEIPSGLFPLSIDSWQLDKIPAVVGTAMSACLIGYMESIAIGKNLANANGYEIEAGQEMLALGISNLVGAAFSCYPVTGSFSRSAVNNSTGAQTQLSGVITALVMLCTLLFLTPLFYHLPKFALAAIVMNSVIPLVALGEAKHLFHVKKHDFLLWVTAFLGTLFLGVLMGIMVAVGLSLTIVIYESARPQITILWRIPGTSIYRNMKQESSGTFIQNVFIARIGSSLYFANASFVKDMLLAHVSDLELVNKTEYIVLEMTPVISVDSSACHVIKDVVNDFRMRGMQVAFAMVGNRVEKTLRKAGLKKFIGDQWFFPTVEEAVQYCVKHQHARRVQDERSSRAASGMITAEEEASVTPIDISTIQVHCGNEIGFSNDLHSNCTMVFISLVKDVPMIMSEIANVFKKNQVSIIRAQIDPSNDESGAKHIYFVRSIRSDSKLTGLEISRLREDRPPQHSCAFRWFLLGRVLIGFRVQGSGFRVQGLGFRV
ncbi:SULTR4 [Symbiodinium natans]|uniref:SULTR4 protein n=1 Tax=Symbiodinium natans TaxID=878477 RepID=A0A812UJ98_9DINO|nr:SULTR4 [Symbiodinium natans]